MAENMLITVRSYAGSNALRTALSYINVNVACGLRYSRVFTHIKGVAEKRLIINTIFLFIYFKPLRQQALLYKRRAFHLSLGLNVFSQHEFQAGVIN